MELRIYVGCSGSGKTTLIKQRYLSYALCVRYHEDSMSRYIPHTHVIQKMESKTEGERIILAGKYFDFVEIMEMRKHHKKIVEGTDCLRREFNWKDIIRFIGSIERGTTSLIVDGYKVYNSQFIRKAMAIRGVKVCVTRVRAASELCWSRLIHRGDCPKFSVHKKNFEQAARFGWFCESLGIVDEQKIQE